MSKLLRGYGNVLLWLVVITYLSTMSPGSVPKMSNMHIPHLDKLVHCVMYLVLSFLLSLVLVRKYEVYTISIVVVVFLFTVSYGIAMELVQKYVVKTRTGDIIDALANSIGAIMGIVAFYYMYKKRNSRENTKTRE